VIWLGGVPELQRIEQRDCALVIGAGASLEAAWRALADALPSLREMGMRFASPPIRHAGTMGGNIANGSPIGDSAPVLMALDAELDLRRGSATRRLRLDAFYVDYMKNRLEPGEFLVAMHVPRAAMQRSVRAYKLSKRFDSDISAVAAGFALTLEGSTVREVRLAFGGMAAVVRRALHAEAALVGQPWTRASVEAAQDALAREFTPLSDLRASATYRLQAAQNLLLRFWLETRPDAPLPAEQLSVWHGMAPDAAVGA
jgi:xanthine dehydrogenase small subunit